MALVGYSDSEGSDSEPQVSSFSKTTQKASSASANKPSFQKVVDPSNPRKIQVHLPGIDSTPAAAQDSTGDIEPPPTKRPKTGGAFSDFNSFLPAPKNTVKSVSATPLPTDGNSGRMSRARGSGLGAGINLRTGAVPAFSRNQNAEDLYTKAGEDSSLMTHAQTTQAVSIPPEPEVKLVGKPNMFKPLSVARKPTQKKAVPLPSRTTEQTGSPSETAINEVASKQQLPPVTKPKKSLFSTEEDNLPTQRTIVNPSGYIPLDADVPAPQDSNMETHEVPASTFHTEPQQPATLSALADSLSLTPAQRRHLFGRNGIEAAAQIANFNLSAEYKHNTVLRESGQTAPLHNPVRSIATGKHSLQQLVNMATTQKDALEESFQHGKNNRKEAGSKYGW